MRKTAVRIAMAALATLLLMALLAGTALAAVSVEARIQTLNGEIAPPTWIDIPDGLTVTDAADNVIECGTPNALGALYLLAGEYDLPFATTWGGQFIDTISGRGVWPESWWGYTVNGWFADVGAFDFLTQDGDVLVFSEIPGNAPFAGIQLVVEGPEKAFLGSLPQPFRVLADNLSFANSAADAVRFGLDPATSVQMPQQFTPVAGATLHVGNHTYETDENGEVTAYAVGLGLHRVYATKDYDDDFFYVPSSSSRTVLVAFADVAPGHPFHRAIHEIAARGIVGGYPLPGGADFRPANSLWRAQLAKMLCLALDLEVTPYDPPPFTDLGGRNDAGYPHDFVGTAYAAGIVKGYAAPRENEFGTYDNVTRAQVVTMVIRALEQLHDQSLERPGDGALSTWGEFSDVHEQNAAIAQHNGLLDGLDLTGAAADPWAPMPRGETAQVIYNAIMLLEAL
jgi:hypothetical protein